MVNLHLSILNSYILPTLTLDVSAFCNLTRKRRWWYWLNDVLKVPHLIHTCSPGHPRTIILLCMYNTYRQISYDGGNDSPHRRLQLCMFSMYIHTIMNCSFFRSILKFSLPSQPMKRKRLLQTPYQLNSVVSLGWETSVWIFLLTAPDCPMCFFSEPTSWAVYIYNYYIPVSSCFLKLIITYALILFLSFYV